jgi:hypothetical protein
MRKLLFILFLSLVACRKIEVIPTPQTMNKDIFNQSNVMISDGQDFEFNLTNSGKYTLILLDSISNQVISKEKINGKIGINNSKIYTKSLQFKYLYLVLRDSVNKELGKTLLILK